MKYARRPMWIACALAAAAAPTLAQPAAPAFDESAVRTCAWVTLAPIDRIDAALARGGYVGAGDQLAGLMAGLQLVAAGEIDRAAPAQAVAVAADGITARQAGAFAIPAIASAAPLSRFAAHGEVVAGHPDAVSLGAAVIRRTPGHVILGPLAAGVLAMTPESIAAPVKAPETLLDIRFDAAIARQAAPQSFEAFIQRTAEAPSPSTGNADQQAGEELGRKAVGDWMRRLDEMSFTLATAGEQAVVGFRFAPFALPPADVGAFGRPTFPAGTVARLDLRYPADRAVPAVRDATLALFGHVKKTPDMPLTAAEAADAFAVIADLILGDATSFGASYRGDAPLVVYGVAQRKAAAPLATRVEKAEKALNAVIADAHQTAKWTLSAYDEAGHHVHRLSLSQGGKPAGTFDLTEGRGGRVLMSMCPADDRLLTGAMAGLADAPAGAAAPHLAALSVDLPLAAKMLRELPADAQVPPAFAGAVDALLAAGSLDVTVDGDGKTFAIDSRLPLKNICGAVATLTK